MTDFEHYVQGLQDGRLGRKEKADNEKYKEGYKDGKDDAERIAETREALSTMPSIFGDWS